MKAFEDLLIALCKHIFIFYLVVSGNFIGNTFSCKLQKILETNMFAKHFMGVMLLFFFVVYIEGNKHNPLKQIVYVIVVYLSFLITTNMEITTLLITLFILFIIYIMNEVKVYYSTYENENNELTDILDNIKYTQFTLGIICIALTLFGFFLYMYMKYTEYKGTFSIYKFLFGVTKCKGLSTNSLIIKKNLRKNLKSK